MVAGRTGMTLIPFERGHALVWDATVVDTLAPSYVYHESSNPGQTIATAERNKVLKYLDHQANYLVEPLAFDTASNSGPTTAILLKKITYNLEEAT